jgi:hypothetical protein
MQHDSFSGRVSSEWFDRGAWLSQAAETFADDHQIALYRQQVERFAELRDGETPQMFEVFSNVSGPLRKKELINCLVFQEEKDTFRLYLTFKDLLQMNLKNRLNSGSLVAFGARGAADADFIWIPPQAWFYLRFHFDEGNVVRGEGMTYWYVRVINPCTAIGAAASQAQTPEVQKQEVKPLFQSEVEDAFLAWARSMNGKKPTIRECSDWGRDNKFGVQRGRELYGKYFRQGLGRRPKIAGR